MIPALSSRNLLPDQGIPRLMPRVGPGRGWVKTATCHKKLVETIKTKGEKLNEDDKLNVAIAVATVDFLSSAHEPYHEQMTPPSDLCRELEAIERHLESPKFAGIMAKLDLFTAAKTVTKYFPEFSRNKIFAKNTLGLTRHHLAMIAAGVDKRFQESAIFLVGLRIIMDISLMTLNSTFSWFTQPSVWTDRLPKLLDSLGRSPIHIAALFGKSKSLASMLSELSGEARKSVIQAGGLDDLTPLNLVSKIGNLGSLDFLKEHGGKQSLEKKDSWGRQPLHIASRLGHTKLITQLLHMGSRSNELDEAGRLFVDYLVENATRQRDDSVSQTQQNTDSSVTGSPNVAESMFNPCFNALLKFAMDPSCRYSSGKSFLHIAVEVANDDSIRSPEGKGFNIEAQDKNGCTPLRYAIIGGRTEVFKFFLHE
ncbi:ankyrin repeat-containing domain protein [Colletotrichum lupini]|nr:ankyrin repeat-containing domain protein [Colletotrichum lupini]